MRSKIIILFFLFTQLAFAQPENMNWWNNRHGWDYVRSWSEYIEMQPGTLGPNALPIQELRNGGLDTSFSLLTAGEAHSASNDFTANLFLSANIPIKNAVSLQIWWVPIEYFKTDTLVRDFRKARSWDPKGTSVGDAYIATVIPLVRNHIKWPDILLGINLKTASGNNLENARFTDTPGYSFDVSFGKTYPLGRSWTIRPHAMSGFYVYQTNRTDYFQNDCIMWGVGADFRSKDWLFKAQATGYSGYFGEYDQPAVIRLEASRWFEHARVFVRYQKGNDSFPWHTFRIGAEIHYSKKK